MTSTRSCSWQQQNSNIFATGDDLHTELWKACAGPLVDLPSVGDAVYYFPQGHLEQFEASTDHESNQQLLNLPSKILCRLVDVKLGAKEGTDDVYAQITLMPEANAQEGTDDVCAQITLMPEENQIEPTCRIDFSSAKPSKATVHSFSKVLTASDLSTRYGLYVPKEDANKCLPRLDMTETIPTQTLEAKDLHGKQWKFKHTFRGQRPRHMLTTGWSAFLTSKRLVSGDTFVFLRGEDGEMRVGVRRVARPKRSFLSSGAEFPASLVKSNFVVHCKPRLSQFVITLNKYVEARNRNFCIGMKIKMPYEVEGTSEKRFIGTIVGVGNLCHKNWPNSEWRCLKIQWDGPPSITRPENVCPWEIEPLENIAPRATIQIGEKQISTELHLLVSQKGNQIRKRKLLDHQPKEQVEGLDTVVRTGPRPMIAAFDNPEGFGIQNDMGVNLWEDAIIQGTNERRGSVGDPLSSPNNTLASNGSNSWLTNLLQGIDQEEIEPETQVASTHLLDNTDDHMPIEGTLPRASQPISSNMVVYISSTRSLIPCNGPGRGDEQVPWESYLVARRCIPTLNRIITRYPESLSRFRAMSNVFQSMLLEILAEVVYRLEHLTVGNIDPDQLDFSKRYLNDLKMNGIEVDWIEKRLLQIDALFKKHKLVQRQEELNHQFELLNAKFAQLKGERETVDKELRELTSKISNQPLTADQLVMQGLL